MATLKRLDRIDVATADLADAAQTYENNFGFQVTQRSGGESATVRVGNSEIRLAAGAEAAQAIAKTGEGMFALWLEAEDLDRVADALRKEGIEPGPIRIESGRRILAVDPRIASQVPLYIFDRKG